MIAFNEYRSPEELSMYAPGNRILYDRQVLDEKHRQARNAAKRRRHALRAPKRTPRRVPGDWDFSKIELRIGVDPVAPYGMPADLRFSEIPSDWHVGVDPGFGDPS